jgi:hypothetical protein
MFFAQCFGEYEKFSTLKSEWKPGVVVHTFNHRTWEPGLHSETQSLLQKTRMDSREEINAWRKHCN